MSESILQNPLWATWAATPPPTPGPAPLLAEPAALPPPEHIPPRAWLYGTRLIRGFVSVLAAPGGVGKSAMAIAQALALASGRPLLGERVHHRTGVWLLNLEDPMEETERRIAAAMKLHALTPGELDGRLHLHSGRNRRVTMVEHDAAGLAYPDRTALITACQARAIGLVVVDPFVKSHRLDENSNGEMDAAATAWAEVAQATGAAILLVHHVRKGAGEGVELMRGAKALSDAARSASLLLGMTEEEARSLHVPERERWRHVRLEDAKANLAPRGHGAQWFRLETVALGNATEDYPEGDLVGALAPWRPPSPFAGLSAADCNKVLDAIAAGDGEGAAWSAHRTGRGQARWAGQMMADRFGLEPEEAARVLATWLQRGLLVEAEYRHPTQRKTRLGLRVIDAKRPTVSAPRTGEPA